MRSTMVLALGVLVAAIGLAAQAGQPPRAAGAGLTMNKTMTEADYAALMKQIGPLAGALRKNIEGQMAAETEDTAGKIEDLFDDVEDYWDQHKVADAEDWAEDASDHAGHVEDAAEAKDFGKAAEHLKLLMGTCQTCHTKYRDKAPDGTYMIKKVG